MNLFKKTIRSLSILTIGIPLLSGCNVFSSSNVEEIKTVYMEKALGISSFIEIDNNELAEMLDYQSNGDKFDFILLVYASGCPACTVAKSNIEKLVKETGYKIYSINKVYYETAQEDQTLNLPAVGGTPQILFFSHRKVVRTIKGVSSDYSQFKNEIAESNKYTNVNSYDVNDYSSATIKEDDQEFIYHTYSEKTTTTLDKLISTEPEVVILFTWKVCGDCSNLYDSFYMNFMNEDKTKKFYCFDVNYFRLTKPLEEPEDQTSDEYGEWKKWIDFSSKYGFGVYRDGKVPSFVKFVNGKFSQMVVYANEGEAKQNSDGTYSYPLAYNDDIKKIKASNVNDLKVKANVTEINLIKSLYQ